MITSDNKLIITWQTGDVELVAEMYDMPTPTHEQCVETLIMADGYHDATIGINWMVLHECLRIVQEGEGDEENDSA
jgi:hypothetical protein